MADFKFSPSKVSEAVEQKLAIKRLPSWAQGTEQIQKYFDDAIQQWFTPEQQRTIDGYVGQRGGSNSAGKTFIQEISNDRTNYQLQPAMVSTTATNEIQSMLTYPDLVDHLGHIGCLNENESRLLGGRTYSWAPPINPDMIMNYSNYYWDTTNSEGMVQPDYIVMERGALDGNSWSVSNHWYPINFVDENGVEITITPDDVTSGRFIQAKRPIIEYKKNLQLYNYGRNSRGTVDLVSDITRPEQIVHRSIFDNVRVDGEILRDGDRILFTSISNAGENNRVYKVVFERFGNKDVYGLHLDTDEQTAERPSGEPKEYDTIRALRGTDFGGAVFQWTGSRWELTQQKETINQIPYFNLFDKDGVALDDATKYPRSDFQGSPIFAVKIDFTASRDVVYNLNIKKDQYGSLSYENHIQSDKFTYISRDERVEIVGAKFYAINDEDPANDAIFNDWLESDIQSRQYITQVIEPTTYITNAETGETAYNTEYELSVPVGINPPGVNYPLVRVDISGEILGTDQYEINDTTLTIKTTLDDESMITVYTLNDTEVPNELGSYEVPSNLKHNANNTIIEEIDETRLADHFYDIIQSQENFQGSAVGVNNYYTSARDMSVGRRIVQHDASLLPLMLHASSERLDILKAADFVKVAYNNFMSKFKTRLEYISDQGFGSLTPDQVVSQILDVINVGKSSEFAFWLSGLGTNNTIQRAFVPATPQYLGILPPVQPEIRKKMMFNGEVGVFNRSHTGAYSRAYSSIDANGDVIADYRDDVLYYFEYLMYQSIPLKFRAETYIPALHYSHVKPGGYRSTDYSLEEWKKISLRSFEQWAISNSVDYTTNYQFDQADFTTWNYTGTLYKHNNVEVKGGIRAIFDYMFDTTHPHTRPWEMLGFASKPAWWDDEYISDGGIDDAIVGAAYLPSGEKSYYNLQMVADLENGFVRAGDREGTYTEYARPGLSAIWPVEQLTGKLLSPWEAGIIDREPTIAERIVSWTFGDIGDVEYAYMNSNYYAFEEAMVLFRAKPAQWTNYFWDTESYSLVSQEGGQTHWLHDETERRLYFDRLETVVHGEQENRVLGYQMWVADYLKHNHINIVTSYGDIMRGAGVKLAYRLGGFSKNENLSFVSDNFGLVSQENQQLHLLKSAVRRQEVISGVSVRWDGKAYIVSGFNSSNPRFSYFKPVKTAKKTSVRIGNKSLVLYSVFDQTKAYELAYDTRFKTLQEVFDFFIGYGQYLESRGWIFEDQVDGDTFDWRFMAAGFVNWAQGDLEADDYITLTPASKVLKFATEHGNIDSVTQFSGGAWTLVDDSNSGIGMHEINVSRIGNIMNIRLLDDVDKRIMLARIDVNEYEHVVVFDNTTIFNDLMYLPDFGLHQPRLRVYGNVSDMWNGRLEAPGFMIVDDTTMPNFEKLVNDFTKYYDNENPGSSVELNDLARHAIGFQSREWLRRLILNDRSQVDFYKGFIKEKGTVQSFDNILRASKELNTPNYKVIEEWAFLSGEYGDIDNQQYMEFLVQSNELRQNPQYCVFDESFTEDIDYDDVITFFGKQDVDPRWITRSKTTKFPTIDRVRKANLPDYGPVTLTEVTTVVQDVQDLRKARENGTIPVQAGERVWILDHRGTWDILELEELGDDVESSTVDGVVTTLNFTNTLNDLQTNDIWFVYAPNNQHKEFTVETYFQTIIDSHKLISPVSKNKTFTNDKPVLYRWRSIFANNAEKQAYVDSKTIKAVDIERFERPVVYNRATNQTETYLTLWDPIEGIVPGIAEAEIDYKMRRDPAMYNNIDKEAQAWGINEVGNVWWDTTNAKYVDYKQTPRLANGYVYDETNEDERDIVFNYRRNNWGKMLPGSSIDIYEWVRSPVPPVQWEEYVEKQGELNKATNKWTPSGEALLDNWCENYEFDVNSNEFKTYYYFWVKGAYTVPNVTGRDRSISEIARIIDDPSTLNIPWFAPVTEDAFIVSGINTIITDNHSVLQIAYKTLEADGNIHKQWRLFQEGNDYYFDDDMWQSMVDSLVGETVLPQVSDEVLTQPVLYPSAKLGNKQGQTWFKDILEARREFVEACNQYFATVNIIGDLTAMNDVFNYEETAVNPYIRDFEVVEHAVHGKVLKIIDADRFSDYDPVVLGTNGILPKDAISTVELSTAQVYFIERVEGETTLFHLNSSAAPGSHITLDNKGNGQHTILRSADVTATLSNALDMKNYWEYVDWYDEGYSSETPYTEVASLAEADTLNFVFGDVVRIQDGDNWTMYTKDFSRDVVIWKSVGRYRSTVKLNDLLITGDMFDTDGNITDRERITRQAIRLLCTVFGSSQSRIVFPMVYYVHHEQTVVDWVFKTSYVTILGIDRTLDNTIVTHNDAISDVLEYINEVKPYRTKIRTSILQRTSDKDTIVGKAWDTDGNNGQEEEFFVDYQQMYKDEWAKPEHARDFSAVRTNFRQSQEVVFFDQVSAEPDLNLISSVDVPDTITSLTNNRDQLNVLPAEVLVQGLVATPRYNGTYYEVLDSNNIPVMNAHFSPYGNDSVLVDRTAKVYMKVEDGKTYYIWRLVGLGWVLSQNPAKGQPVQDWYYEDIRSTGEFSANPYEVQLWLDAGKRSGANRGTTTTPISVTLQLDNREREDRSMYIDRFKRNTTQISKATTERLRSLLEAEGIVVEDDEWFDRLLDFVTPGIDGASFNLVKFAEVAREWDFAISDDTIIQIVNDALIDVRFEQQLLNTANRIRIYNPDADQDFIDQIMKSEFKGIQIHNQPSLRGPIGYGPASYDDTFGYYQWEDNLYNTMLNRLLIDEGMDLFDAQEKLRLQGFAEVVRYKPYQDVNTEVTNKSIWIQSPDYVQHKKYVDIIRGDEENDTGMTINELELALRGLRDTLNDLEWDSDNPLINESLERMDGFVNDIANYDNFGYDRITRSVEHIENSENNYLFDIGDLDMESHDFGNLTATITSYRPDQFEAVDYGIYHDSRGAAPGSSNGGFDQVNPMDLDYIKFDHFDITLLVWDFGNDYGKAIAYREGSFSLEGRVYRDPRNPDRVIVTSPRAGTVNTLSNNWDRDMDGLYTEHSRDIYQFSLTGLENDVIDQVYVGENDFVDGDMVILFAQDDIYPTSNVDWNDVDDVCYVKVIGDGFVEIYDDIDFDNATQITFRINDQMIKHQTSYRDVDNVLYMGATLTFSMLKVVPPKALTDIKIDTLNYRDVYGRFMSGGDLFNIPTQTPDSIVVEDHGLVTGDQVVFGAVENLDVGDIILGSPYFVVVAGDELRFTSTIEDAIQKTGYVDIGTELAKCGMTVVNYWITSTLTTERLDVAWHNNTDSFIDSQYSIDSEGKDFVHDPDNYEETIKRLIERVDNPIGVTEVVDQGFSRPTIDAGSLRELVRGTMQEHLSITVLQHNRATEPAESSKVKDKNGELMHYVKHANDFGFRLTLSPDNQVMEIKRLGNDLSFELGQEELLYNATEFLVKGDVPSNGTLEINGEFIKYARAVDNGDGTHTISGFTRGDRYTYEEREHQRRKICDPDTTVYTTIKLNVMEGLDQGVSRVLAGSTGVSNSINDRENYSHSSTILFDTTKRDVNGDPITDDVTPVASVTLDELKLASDFNDELREKQASFKDITGIGL